MVLAPQGGRRSCDCSKTAHKRTASSERAPSLVNVFDSDVSRKHASLHVRTSHSEQDIVRMPVDREDGGADQLLELFCDPPVVVRIERTNCNCPFELVAVRPNSINGKVELQCFTLHRSQRRIYLRKGSSGQRWPEQDDGWLRVSAQDLARNSDAARPTPNSFLTPNTLLFNCQSILFYQQYSTVHSI
jgi:hypothetical protein